MLSFHCRINEMSMTARDFFLIIILCFGIACAAICVTRVAIFTRQQNRGNNYDLISGKVINLCSTATFDMKPG